MSVHHLHYPPILRMMRLEESTITRLHFDDVVENHRISLRRDRQEVQLGQTLVQARLR